MTKCSLSSANNDNSLRHAYLITAHTNLTQLRLLIAALDHNNNDIYVHIDFKSNISEQDITDCVSHSKLYVIKKHSIIWGEYTLTAAIIDLIKISTHNHYYYYHLLSGMDLPLKNISYINNYFEENARRLGFNPEYIHFADSESSLDAVMSRLSSGNVSNVRFSSYIAKIMRIIHRVQYRINPSIYGYGSCFFDITHDLATCIVKNSFFIKSHFLCFTCADEHFVQTIVNKEGYRNRCYMVNEPDANYKMIMRLIDFSRGHDSHPYTFTISDKNELIKSSRLFARKFDENIDKDIIKWLVDYIKH